MWAIACAGLLWLKPLCPMWLAECVMPWWAAWWCELPKLTLVPALLWVALLPPQPPPLLPQLSSPPKGAMARDGAKGWARGKGSGGRRQIYYVTDTVGRGRGK